MDFSQTSSSRSSGNGNTNHGSADEKDLSSQAQSCFMRLRKGKILGFFVCLALGVLCLAMALAAAPFICFLTVIKIKFAVLFTLGYVFALGSFSFLWGPWSHIKHLCSRNRLPFTTVYLITITATLYFALKALSTVLTLIFAIMTLAWFLASHRITDGTTTGLTSGFESNTTLYLYWIIFFCGICIYIFQSSVYVYLYLFRIKD